MQLLSPMCPMVTPGLPPCATAPSLVGLSLLFMHSFHLQKEHHSASTPLLSAAWRLRQVVIGRMTRR